MGDCALLRDYWRTAGLLIPPAVVSVFEISEALYSSVPIDFPYVAKIWALFGTVAFFVFIMERRLKECV